MQHLKVGFLFAVLALFSVSCEESSTPEPEPKWPNRAYEWGKITLEATARDTDRFNPRPTITSRILALIWTSVYDAWSRYDDFAEPMYLQDVERAPKMMRTLENKEIAISYAAYRACLHYYFADAEFLRDAMLEMGLDPDNESIDPSTPEGLGNLAAKMVIETRLEDGSNELGTDGIRYADYTGYVPVNHPDTMVDVEKWQPKYFVHEETGERFAPECLSPQWHLVEPVFLDSASQHRPGPPPAVGSEELLNQVREVISLQTNLVPWQKALVEFMRDGPHSVQQAGHWLIFAQHVSARDRHTLDEDVLMYFWVEAVAMDAFIACWDAKMFYDFARPYALIREILPDTTFVGWAGPDKGWQEMQGREWIPYSPFSFLCPPFPAYTSGHSTVSGACSHALKLFKGNDYFDHSVRLKPGVLTEAVEFQSDSVELYFATFTDAAEAAGISRVMGGYHIQADNIEGLEQGRRVAQSGWDVFRTLTGWNRRPTFPQNPAHATITPSGTYFR